MVKELDQMRKCSHIIVPNLCELDAYEPYIADMKRIRSKTETNIVNDKVSFGYLIELISRVIKLWKS